MHLDLFNQFFLGKKNGFFRGEKYFEKIFFQNYFLKTLFLKKYFWFKIFFSMKKKVFFFQFFLVEKIKVSTVDSATFYTNPTKIS